MKKIIVSLVIMGFLFSVAGPPAFAAQSDTEKALEIIEKTNQEIDEKIEKAVEKADETQADFLQELRILEEGKELVKLNEEKNEVFWELQEASQVEKIDNKKIEKLIEKSVKLDKKIKEERDKVEGKLLEIQAETADLTAALLTAEGTDKEKIAKKIRKLEEKLSKKGLKYQERMEKYTNDLEKIINDVYDETLEMSAKTIKKAADLGVEAECSWKLVRFADRWVWIDPIKVVGW
ncbi:hypothetical protein [Bacillus sp. RO1]|uniref:hypothetical protein n=1 Tax=Bacillus sp. RO1 TaxID=2722703 RepID=UPI001456859A|nr:hypothetical protein [Bacillus sp. RO1]NLP50417.1 hypothetical protein [Bacillus sp. RO1]